ncbi:MAG: MFS transporter [Elusimicrobiota bacterium]|nr:MFS transporter [Elusimicrobiota bacterium]
MSRWTPSACLLLLTAVNVLNYVDRQVAYALLPLISGELALTDAQAGSLASAFMVVYMVAAPPIAWFADSRGRRPWIAGGIALWSVATAAAGLTRSFPSLFLTRALVGVGEACYGAISPSFVAERFPPERRGWALAVFSMAIPVGSALGYAGGGWIGQHFGWRNAFFLVGLPGLLLAAVALTLPKDEPRPASAPWEGYRSVWSVPTFRLITFAGAAMTFALGGFAVWMPTFFHRAWGLPVGTAGLYFGGVTVAAGLAGSLLGGWLADRLIKTTPHAYLLISGGGLLAGMPFAMGAIVAPNLPLSIAALFAAETLLFLNMGPLNAAIVSVTRLETRSMAFAANIFIIHALGDAVSPTLIGLGSDLFGLANAMLVACAALGLGGWLCLLARRRYDADAAAATAGAPA